MFHILVVEDDQALNKLICKSLLKMAMKPILPLMGKKH